MTSKNTPSVEELFGDMVQATTKWTKANEAFYEWETAHYGDESDLSDDDRMLWVEGYLQALRDAK